MNYWNQFPILRLILPFIFGIILAIFYQKPNPFISEILIALFILAVITAISKKIYQKYKYRWFFGLILNLTLFLAGYQLTINKTEKFYTDHFSNKLLSDNEIIAKVIEPVSEKARSIKTVVEIELINQNGNWLNTNGKAIVYFKKDSLSRQIRYGDKLLIASELKEITVPQNPYEFNYKRYLSFHSIYHQAYVTTGNWRFLETGGGNILLKYANNLRNKFLDIFRENNVTGEEFAVASALILGYKDELDSELRRAYASSGAMHVLAVSGLHVGIIFLVLNSLLFFLDKIRYGRIFKAIILILFLWSYALLTGLSPSVMRAATMFSFIIVGQSLNKYTNIYNTLGVSAFVLLLFNPYLIVKVGFQLSYLAVLGIVLIQPKLYKLWETDNWLLDKIWAITTVSIAAQIATFPLGLLYFHQFPNYFLLSNLIVIPMATVIIYFGILIFVFSPITWLTSILVKIFTGSIAFLNGSVKFIEQIPYSLTQGISINIIETWIIYALIISALAFFMINQVKYLKFGLAMITLLLIFQVVGNYFEKNQQIFIVYNIPKTSAYDLINGKQNILIADSSLINDESKLLFHIKHNWWELGLNNNKMVEIDRKNTLNTPSVFLKDNFIQFHNKRILVINSDHKIYDPEKKIKVNYLIISQNPYLKLKDLVNQYKFDKIIIDSSNPWWKTKKWLTEANELGIDCYSVSEQGAFVVEV